jgi:hypothetical protein
VSPKVLSKWPTPRPPRLDHENAIVGRLPLQNAYQSRGLLSRQTTGQTDQNESGWAQPLSDGKIAEVLVLGHKDAPFRDRQVDYVVIGGARAHVSGSHYLMSCRPRRIPYDR